MTTPRPSTDNQRYARLAGFLVGSGLFAGMLAVPAPDGMSSSAQRMAAIALLMAAFWVGETVPLAVTALIPLVAFPLMHIMSTTDVAPHYANQWVFLLLGGFFIALSMQKWNLHKRIALHIIRVVGVSARRLVLGFMIATAFLSMWISNSATAMMMMPIALAIIMQIEEVAQRENEGELSRTVRNFGTALSLAIAYAANIGGVGTLVGTFPNVVFGGMVRELFVDAPEISFTSWFVFALPFVIVFVPLIWFLLVTVLYPVRGELITSADELIDHELEALGPMRRGEIDTAIVFAATAVLWVFRRDLELGVLTIPGWSNLLDLAGLVNDATVAICMGGLLFFIPVDFRRGLYVMDWEWGARTPWGLLILFSGGFAVAAGFVESGLAQWIGERLQVLEGVPVVAMIFFIAILVTFLTEMTSNTATTTMMMPILAVTAVAMNTHPFLLMLPAVVSASCAFMLPIATPPNAVSFTTGRVTIWQMFRAGLALNIIGALLVTALILTSGRGVFRATAAEPPAWAVIRDQAMD